MKNHFYQVTAMKIDLVKQLRIEAQIHEQGTFGKKLELLLPWTNQDLQEVQDIIDRLEVISKYKFYKNDEGSTRKIKENAL